MRDEQTSLKQILDAIEEYYSGRQLEQICEELEIEQEVFNNWVAEYKHIAIDIMALRLENERLRRMFVDLSLKRDSLNDNRDQGSNP